MTKSKKTLKEKLGTPEEVEKKVKKKKGGDGLKQSKLNFEKKGAKIVIIDIWTVLMFLLSFFSGQWFTQKTRQEEEKYL